MPGKYSSGQACASAARTSYSLPRFVPGRNPIATRAGMPSERALITIAVAYWVQ